MKDTTKIMLESDFGFDTSTYSKNREILDDMNFVSEEVRQLTGYTPEKVAVLSDGNNIYIEFAGNLERLMNDGGYDLREALDMVMMHNNLGAYDANIIVDESSIDRIDIDALIKEVGTEHVFRK
jgi:hypothetical protein